MKKKLTLNIIGMHCQNCSTKIKDVLSSMTVENLERQCRDVTMPNANNIP